MTMTPRPDDELVRILGAAGIARPAIDAVLRIDVLLQTWRRRIGRRELAHIALADLAIDIDLAGLDVLLAIEGPSGAFDEATEGEVTVGTVAERLGIDPSRASRIAAQMVDRGHARRGVSQADARRVVIRLTERGAAVVAAVRAHKSLLLGDFLSEWSAETLESFVQSLERFSAWSDEAGARRPRFEAEIAAIAAKLREENGS